MESISRCPICGKEMTVVGNTTLHYECLECNKERELMISKIGNDLAQIYTLNDLTKAQLQSIAGYIDRGYTDNSVYKSMRLKTWNEDEIRADERIKVAEEIKSIIFIDGTGISCNNSYNRLAKVANYCNAQLNEKKVEP